MIKNNAINFTTDNYKSANFVKILRPPVNNLSFEAKIFELRAITNYTFKVMSGGLPGDLSGFSKLPIKHFLQKQQAKTLETQKSSHQLNEQQADVKYSRVETKPFTAFASECLSNSSNVVVQTGRYFGGKISIEDKFGDPKCSLLGNKTSDQSAYEFRIDYDTCGSKLIDGNRIESMILVHENKNILTHNSARFLVVCNFVPQTSFTVRASISMPSHKAKIDRIDSKDTGTNVKPTGETTAHQTVFVGNEQTQNEILDSNSFKKTFNEFDTHNSQFIEQNQQTKPNSLKFATNTQLVRRDGSGNNNIIGAEQQSELLKLSMRQPKLLAKSIFPLSSLSTQHLIGQQMPESQSDSLSQVQAKNSNNNDNYDDIHNDDDDGDDYADGNASKRLRNQSNVSALANSASLQRTDINSDSIVLSNNHRISQHFMPIDQLKTSAQSSRAASINTGSNDAYDESNDSSIRYSGAKIDIFANTNFNGAIVDNLSDHDYNERPKLSSRSGKARFFDNLLDSLSNNNDSVATADGDYNSDSNDEVSQKFKQDNTTYSKPPKSLASNITDYLYRWSINTLENLANKTIDNLISNNKLNMSGNPLGIPSTISATSMEMKKQEKVINDSLESFGTDFDDYVSNEVSNKVNNSLSGMKAANQTGQGSLSDASSQNLHDTLIRFPISTNLYWLAVALMLCGLLSTFIILLVIPCSYRCHNSSGCYPKTLKANFNPQYHIYSFLRKTPLIQRYRGTDEYQIKRNLSTRTDR